MVVVLVVVMGIFLWWMARDSAPDTEGASQRVASAMRGASTSLMESVDAARAPLAVVTPRGGDEDVSPKEQAASAAPAEVLEQWEEGRPSTLKGAIARNESMSAALQKRGISKQAIHAAVSALARLYDFRNSHPGDQWEADVHSEGQITRLHYKTSPEDMWQARRTADGSYVSEKVVVPLEAREELLAGQVTSSLWQSMAEAGLSGPIIGKFMDIFSHELDFNAMAKPGDTFAVLFEVVYLDGEPLRAGRVLAARYVKPEAQYEAYFYETSDSEDAGYYDPQGASLQRQFLKSPLANVRITSPYGRRFHPVLKKWKMHSGVDYGAPTGTPVMSLSDGVVTFAGWKGANGKLVTVKHKNGYTTHYAHLSYIPPSIKPGAKVTKKTQIGKVGSTGRSTGPHLHFGVSKGGKFVDPLKVDMMRALPLHGKERTRFEEHAAKPYKKLLDAALTEPAQLAARQRLSTLKAQPYEESADGEMY